MARKDSVNDYFGLGMRIVLRYHRSLLTRFHDDVEQELHLLAWEAQAKGRIHIRHKRKCRKFGNGRRMGVRSFGRAVNHSMYIFQKNYR